MIGIFDSGYGGLTVLKPVRKRLPQYQYLYLGDNGRAPYGGRSAEKIQTYAREAVDFLFSRGARIILFACNAASAAALRVIQEDYLRKPGVTDRKILGVLIPSVEKAVQVSKTGVIGVVGTRVTVDSMAYVREIQKLRPDARVVQQACPLLVPFIEEGWGGKPECRSILRKYLRPLKSHHIDTLILGCTHYPLMYRAFQQMMGKKVKVLDAGPDVAESLECYLKRHPEIETLLEKTPIAADSTGKGNLDIMTTGDPKRFEELGSQFMGEQLRGVGKVELGKFQRSKSE